jgi:hypothetical protein
LWAEAGCPYEAALCLADADDEARLRLAMDELLALDARPAAAIVARRLRARGVTSLPRGPRASGTVHRSAVMGASSDLALPVRVGCCHGHVGCDPGTAQRPCLY